MNNKYVISFLVLLVIALGVFLVYKKGMRKTSKAQVAKVIPTPTLALQQNEVAVYEKPVGFRPSNITVKKGTIIVFKNETGGKGNVSSAAYPTRLLYPKLNLGDYANGSTMKLEFNEVGTYGYHDQMTPTRFGKIIVTE